MTTNSYSVRHTRQFNKFFEVWQGEILHPGLGKNITRYGVLSKDAVAAIVYNIDTRRLIFVKQFRYPMALASNFRINEIIECVAGGIDNNKNIQESLSKEIEEEIGYKPITITPIRKVYTSPGILGEIVNIFYVTVSNKTRISDGGGLRSEDEYLEIVEYDISNFINGIPKEISDSKTIIGLDWFRNNILPDLLKESNIL